MANKHNPFESLILERLSQGATKSQIARDLAALGVGSTQDQLSRWLKRRADRIVRNARLVKPLEKENHLDGKAKPPIQAATGAGEPAAAPAPVAVPPFDPGSFVRRRKLNLEIPTEEDIIRERNKSNAADFLKKKPSDNS